MRQRDVQRRMFYTPKDGLMLGLLGVLTPVIAMLILGVVMVFIALAGGAGFENLFDSTVFKYITQVIAECAFVLVLYVYNKIAKVDFVSASQFKTAPKYLNWAVAIIIGIAMPIFFSPLISMWERLLDLIGIQLPTLADRGIPLSTGWDLTVPGPACLKCSSSWGRFLQSLFYSGVRSGRLEEKITWHLWQNGDRAHGSKQIFLNCGFIFWFLSFRQR